MTRIEFDLADDLAQQARAAGVLEQEALEALVRAEMKRQAGEQLRAHLDRVRALGEPEPPMDEIVALVKEVRRERRAKREAANR